MIFEMRCAGNGLGIACKSLACYVGQGLLLQWNMFCGYIVGLIVASTSFNQMASKDIALQDLQSELGHHSFLNGLAFKPGPLAVWEFLIRIL
mmetsp:Transcript_159981/g.282057  ORF Transcript_159981/g.282057 Transcript_159981/m.282057 type:complete len:92 (-) Transcript_159981:90-365(-)